jgi:cytochrome c biogenesis protein CcmG/thiol:disulfide interchange protein DsbE
LPSTSSSPTPPEPTGDGDSGQAGPTRRGKWILAGIALALVLVVGCVTAAVVLSSADSGSSAGAAKRSTVKVGEAAPTFEVTTLDGKTVKLSDYAGKPVVLNFWASWCTPCREEFPALRDAYARAHGKWSLVGINSQDFVESDGRKFAKDQKSTWPNGFDADSVVSGEYGVTQLPQTFFIDAKGVIRAHLFGGLTADSLQEELQKLGAA